MPSIIVDLIIAVCAAGAALVHAKSAPVPCLPAPFHGAVQPAVRRSGAGRGPLPPGQGDGKWVRSYIAMGNGSFLIALALWAI